MRALVTGGTGFVGSHLVELLVQQGWTVVCPVRNPDKLRHLRDIPATVIPMERLEEEIRASPAFDYVFHAAASTRSLSYEEYRRANVDFTRRLLELFSLPRTSASLKRFVFVSSQAAAGPSPDHGAAVTETDPARPVSSYGRTKLEAEESVLSFRDRVPVTIIRPPTVFGPRDVDVLGVFKSAQHRFAAYIAGPDRLVSIVYVPDLVLGTLAAAESAQTKGEIYFMANPEPIIWREFAHQVAECMGVRVISLPVPLALMRLAALAGDVIGKVQGSARLFRSEKIEEMRQIAWVCSSEKAYRDFGWRPRFPLDDAICVTAEWYRRNGWL